MQPKASPHNSSLAVRRTKLAEAAATVEYSSTTESREVAAFESRPSAAPAVDVAQTEERPAPPDWIKGQLLNVRNTGPDYVVTLFPEEFDPRHPERALRFANPARCQDFVSKWYAREHCDPRAF